MQYSHWLMVAGGVPVVIGFIGFAIQKNNAETVENNKTSPTDEPNHARPARAAELKAKGK
jgi:hypothetical protein